jgi:hypothetical protein
MEVSLDAANSSLFPLMLLCGLCLDEAEGQQELAAVSLAVWVRGVFAKRPLIGRACAGDS